VIVGALKIKLHIFGASSLKEKRKVLKPIKDKVSSMNASIAEIGDNDLWQSASIGLVMVSNDSAHINSMMDKFMQTLIVNDEIEIVDSAMEIIHL